MLIGTENERFCALAMMAVLIPTTRADVSTKGPPELPGLSATSVWSSKLGRGMESAEYMGRDTWGVIHWVIYAGDLRSNWAVWDIWAEWESETLLPG